MTAFVVEAGLDFVGNMVLKDMSTQQAFNSINWGKATGAAAQSYAMSLVISGVGSIKALAKATKSPIGRVVINFTSSVTNNLIDKYKDGDFNDINGNFSIAKVKSQMLPIMGEALISSLISEGFTKKAKQIEMNMEKLYSKMYQQEQKLQRNLIRNASTNVISNRMKKVNDSQKAYLKEFGKYSVFSGLQQSASGVAGKSTGLFLNRSNDDR